MANATLQERITTLAPPDVLAQAKRFFPLRNTLYAAFLEKEGPTYVTFRGQGGEEIVIAATPKDGATLVTGSTYLFDMQVARFLDTLPEPASAGSGVRGAPGVATSGGAEAK
ncbi:MAG TPA: hypothetical protein VKH19_17465 [Gemmatimonadaceae bacterium]|nr:hypothetical protein [Gemmatimonadaceae bacterium]